MTKQEAKQRLDEFLAKKGETLDEHLLRTNPLYAKLKLTEQKFDSVTGISSVMRGKK